MADSRKPHWRTVIKRMDPSYLYAEDLGPPGTTADVEISDSGVGQVKNPGGSKEIIWLAFKGKSKKLGLNATMAKTLTSITNSSWWGDWRGWITLVVIHKTLRDPTTGDQEPMDVIRIAPERPRAKSSPSKPATAPGAPDPDEQADIARRERKEST